MKGENLQMEGGREGGREGERDGGREGGREGEREGERDGGREGGREGGELRSKDLLSLTPRPISTFFAAMRLDMRLSLPHSAVNTRSQLYTKGYWRPVTPHIQDPPS